MRPLLEAAHNFRFDLIRRYLSAIDAGAVFQHASYVEAGTFEMRNAQIFSRWNFLAFAMRFLFFSP